MKVMLCIVSCLGCMLQRTPMSCWLFQMGCNLNVPLVVED